MDDYRLGVLFSFFVLEALELWEQDLIAIAPTGGSMKRLEKYMELQRQLLKGDIWFSSERKNQIKYYQ